MKSHLYHLSLSIIGYVFALVVLRRAATSNEVIGALIAVIAAGVLVFEEVAVIMAVIIRSVLD